MRNVLIGILLVVVSATLLGGASCIRSEKQASKRVANLLSRFPSIIDTLIIDSTITVHSKSDTVSVLDTQFLDRVIKEACDTIRKTERVHAIQYLYKECAQKTITNTIYQDKIIHKEIVIPCAPCKEDTIWQATKKYWGFGLFLFIIVLVIGFIIRH